MSLLDGTTNAINKEERGWKGRLKRGAGFSNNSDNDMLPRPENSEDTNGEVVSRRRTDGQNQTISCNIFLLSVSLHIFGRGGVWDESEFQDVKTCCAREGLMGRFTVMMSFGALDGISCFLLARCWWIFL